MLCIWAVNIVILLNNLNRVYVIVKMHIVYKWFVFTHVQYHYPSANGKNILFSVCVPMIACDARCDARMARVYLWQSFNSGYGHYFNWYRQRMVETWRFVQEVACKKAWNFPEKSYLINMLRRWFAPCWIYLFCVSRVWNASVMKERQEKVWYTLRIYLFLRPQAQFCNYLHQYSNIITVR